MRLRNSCTGRSGIGASSRPARPGALRGDHPLNFLQAHAAVTAFQGGPPLHLRLACSAVTATLDLFVRAHAAQAGHEARVETLPFNSLAQHLRTPAVAGEV